MTSNIWGEVLNCQVTHLLLSVHKTDQGLNPVYVNDILGLLVEESSGICQMGKVDKITMVFIFLG